ncbi:hypothetical protein ACHAW5_005060 [Stephanodiscus triporus]|uniref:Uncharacterized protein n=1 Tax=Stephanodiscus triporus TaxID=2934178 RepID=A0ABD3NCA2_9STRA
MDLARMYDYATWNMYQRIVSARRKRLAQIDLQKMREATGEEKAGAGCTASTDRPSSSSDQDEGSTVSSAVVPPSERQGRQQQQRRPNLHAMNKNPSQDESSTLTTADETDGSSSTSSWSRADSPIVPQWCVASGGGGAGGLAPLRRLGFPSSGTMGIRVAGHPNDDGSHRESTANNEDDAFIFEMDM